MHSKKEYEVKLQKVIEKYEQKLKKEKEKTEECKSEIKYYKRRLKELRKSRDSWKEKNKSNYLIVKTLEHKIDRWGKAKGHHFDSSIVGLCIELRIKANCSYGAIKLILLLLQKYMNLSLAKLPCENSIQNWVSKMGLYELEKVVRPLDGQEVSLIIDESIRLGKEKQLVILAVPIEKQKESALCFSDIEVVHIEGSTSWTSEKISEVIEGLKKKRGFSIKTIISDEASTLKKTSQLQNIPHVPDICHLIGTCLKKTFEKSDEYQAFTSELNSFKSKGVNQDLSYLSPPKQRSKARFMNQASPVKWAKKVLGKLKAKKLKGKELDFFKPLTEHEKIIESLSKCLEIAKEISLPFKTTGLSNKTLSKARKDIEALKDTDSKVCNFLKFIGEYLDKYEEVISASIRTNLHVSSEIIESLFGKFKSKANNYALTGLTRLNLELPLYGLQTVDLQSKVITALQTISMSDLKGWIKRHSTDSQLVKRLDFFKNGT